LEQIRNKVFQIYILTVLKAKYYSKPLEIISLKYIKIIFSFVWNE